MLTTFYPPHAFGGDAVFVQRLAHLLARHGHEVDVIHCMDSYRALATGAPRIGEPPVPGVTVHGLVSGVGVLSPLATHQAGRPVFTSRALRRLLAAKRFDVLHFHNISLLGGPGILGFGQGIKLYTLHDHWLVCPTHVLFKLDREPCVRPTCLRCTIRHRRPPQLWRQTGARDRALRHVDAVIAPSRFAAERHRADGIETPIIPLPPFAGPAAAAAIAPPRLPDRPFFLFAGRLERPKGLDTVIPLFRQYDRADLVIAGDGADGPALRRLASNCPRIHFLGWLPPAELHAAYARAIALVVPSVTFETFGQVVIEAHAARTPVIVRDRGALPEIVGESGGGLVFRTDADLHESLERLRADPALRNALGEAGHRAYRARWTPEAHLAAYLGLIEEIERSRRIRSAAATP